MDVSNDRQSRKDEFSRLIELLRLKQREAADLLGISRTTVSKWKTDADYGPTDHALNILRELAAPASGFSVNKALVPVPLLRTSSGVSEPRRQETMLVPAHLLVHNVMAYEAGSHDVPPVIQAGDVLLFKTTSHPKIGKFMAVQHMDKISMAVPKFLGGQYTATIDGQETNLDGCIILGLLVSIYSPDDNLSIGPVDPGIGPGFFGDRLAPRFGAG